MDPKTKEILVRDEDVGRLKLAKENYIGTTLLKYEGFWYHDEHIKSVLAFQRHFLARNTDVIIGGIPKTGTTWLKSLLFAIVHRVENHQSPLLTRHPHELVCNLEVDVYNSVFDHPRPHHLGELPSPRLLSTHLPYASLPESIRTSQCRIVYICRNPLDMVVSLYYFSLKALDRYFSQDVLKKLMRLFYKTPSIEDFFQAFCDGEFPFGPFFEHVLGFWKMSLERPDKVLFIKYEDMMEDTLHHVKKLAEFVGMPFSDLEENEGAVTQIIEMCNIGNMKELEGNKNGVINKLFEKRTYFRKGEVGDWTHHFTPAMVERVKKLMGERLQGTGLTFKLIP